MMRRAPCLRTGCSKRTPLEDARTVREHASAQAHDEFLRVSGLAHLELGVQRDTIALLQQEAKHHALLADAQLAVASLAVDTAVVVAQRTRCQGELSDGSCPHATEIEAALQSLAYSEHPAAAG